MRTSSAALLLASLSLASCSGSTQDTPAAKPPTPTSEAGSPDGATDAAGVDPRILLVEPDDGMTPIYDLIRSAKKTIDLTLYELTDTMVTGLLTEAAKSGLKVRIILDQNLEMMANTPAYTTLGAGGVSVHWANPVYASTHQKTITVDAKTSAIMTLNLTPDDYVTSRDFAVITTDAADVAAIESTFDNDFTNGKANPPTGSDLVWSPTNAEAALLGIIGGAKTSLLVENEEMGDSDIVAALVSSASHGVDVKVVMENSRSYATEFTALENAGVKLVTYGHAGLYIHAKVILADYGTSAAKAFVGSENFSYASLTENRELGLFTSDAAILGSLNTTLSSDYGGGKKYAPFDGGTPDAGGASVDAEALDAGASETGASETGASDEAGASTEAGTFGEAGPAEDAG